jgi:AcrR family transcriptional regulator
MPNKKPRRTAERILDVSLMLFNRFGEPNVSTSQLCGELGISPGNLFYHHPTKDALVHGLFGRYQAEMLGVLSAQAGTDTTGKKADWPQASPPLQRLAHLCEDLARSAWTYRFVFRDLSDLVSRHRLLEEQLPPLLRQQAACLLAQLAPQNWQTVPDASTQRLWAGPLLATLNGSMGLDGAMDPRERLRENEDQVCERAVMRALGLIAHQLQTHDRAAIAARMAQISSLGQNPWWLASPQE